MKIFNWVHRRFSQKDGLSQNVKKVDPILAKDGETQALLDNVVLADLLDGWRGGVLAIGTFGIDSLHDSKKENEYFQYEEASEEDEYSMEGECDDELDEEEELEEVNPLMVCSAAPSRAAASSFITIDDGPLRRRNDDHSSDLSDSNKWDRHYVMKKERTTLADLFSAESEGNMKSKKTKEESQLMSYKKPNSGAVKNGKTFPKKMIAGNKDDSRPLKKLHKLMKKMLKRKIHPDAEVKVQKDSQIKSSCAAGISSDELENKESVSLLQIQDMLVKCEQ